MKQRQYDRIFNMLPLPSAVQGQRLNVPFLSYDPPAFSTDDPIIGTACFIKDYVDGICIGWKLEAEITTLS